VRRVGRAVLIDEQAGEVRTYLKATKLPEGLNVTVVCANRDKGVVSRARCESLIRSLEYHGLPGGPFAYSKENLDLAGQMLQVPDGCEVMPGNRIFCPKGGLLWFMEVPRTSVTPDVLKELFEKNPRSDSVELKRGPCTVMGAKTVCLFLTQFDEKGRRQKVMGVGTSKGGQGQVVLSCLTWEPGPITPPPCDQVLTVP